MARFQFQKKLLAAGAVLACASMTAHAQSNVTLYGTIDEALMYTSKSPNGAGGNAGKQIQLISAGISPSVFGLKGTEDLGGGWKAMFQLESGINPPDGGFNDSNGNLFGRMAWIALSNNAYGTLKAGVQYSPFVLSLIASDPRGTSFFGSGTPLYVDNVFVTGIFNSNAISYTSPTIAGFQGAAMIALGGTAGSFQSGREYSASLSYTNGPFRLTAAMYDGNSGGSAATTPIPSTTAFTGRTIGASYRWGDLTLKAVYVNFKVASTPGNLTEHAYDNRVIGGGFGYQVTPALNANGGVWYTSDGNHTKNNSILAAAGLTYGLSKRTSIYGQFGYVDNHGLMDTGMSTNGALFGAPGSTYGTAVGVRHTF